MADWSPVDLLPGLWAGVLLVLLARGLARWYDPVPRPVLAAFCIALLALFGRALFGGGILLPLDNLRGQPPFQRLEPTEPHGNILQGDLIQLVAPSLQEARHALGDGRWPLWNDKVGAGMPILADPQAQALQPLALLAAPFPLATAAGVTAALRVLAALVFGFLWLRRQGLEAGAALCGAFAFGLGGFLLLWLGWPLANSAGLLPAVLYGLALWDQRRGRRDLLLLGAALFALLLGGHPETIVYALGIAAAFALDQARRRPQGERLAHLRGAALALLLAAGTAAPALLPAAAYLPETARAGRLGEGALFGPSAGTTSFARWVPVIAPNAFGNSRFVHYWGPANTNEDAGGFAGTATLLAATLALFPPKRRFPQERLALIGAAACLALVAGLGLQRLMLPLGFFLAYLGACSVERFARGEAWRWAVLPAALLLGLAIAWGYLAHPDPADPGRLAVLRFGWLRWQGRFLVAGALLLAAGFRRSWMPYALSALIAAELVLAHGPANPPMPKRLAFPMNPAVRYLAKNLGEDRMVALGSAFPPNLPALYGLADARIYNPAAPRAWQELTEPLVAGWGSEVPEFGRPAHPLYGRLGVRLFLTGPEDRPGPPLREVFADGTARIYERPGALPLLFLAGRGRVYPLAGLARSGSRITARVSAAGPGGGALESSLYQDGGWRLLADDRRRPAGTALGALLAARLPPGTARIDLLYRSPGFIAGCALAALAIAAAAVLLIPAPLPPRRGGPLEPEHARMPAWPRPAS